MWVRGWVGFEGGDGSSIMEEHRGGPPFPPLHPIMPSPKPRSDDTIAEEEVVVVVVMKINQ